MSPSPQHPTQLPFAGTPRYIDPVVIGIGGTGVVYRVRDKDLGRDVALKTLPSLGDPDRILHLKDEFRTLRGLTHVNLIRLYELTVTDEVCFFTMELVDGVDFVTHVRTPVLAMERLRAAAVQLVDGLSALHAAGIIHRDVKPANVLVASTGRVVVLDFGLASTTVSPASWQTSTGVKGTFAYMPPEQLWGRPLGPEADWYAVGVLLFEAMTGRLPFSGSMLEMAHAKEHGPIPRLRAEGLAVSERIDSVVTRLLSPTPSQRPDAAMLRGSLAAAGTVPPVLPRGPNASPRGARAHPFVGRARESASLRIALDRVMRGEAVTLCVEGVSGIGKSELVTRFLAEERAARGVVALTGRCHPRESMPFKALDGVVDDLSRFLVAQSAPDVEVLMPRHAGALLRLFPVLGRVAPMAARADLVPTDAREIRRRGVAALRELLGRLAERRPVVVWIDDLQWGDLDSARLLHAVLAAPDPPSLLLVLSCRSDDDARRPLLEAIGGDGDRQLEMLQVGPLDAAASESLAAQLRPGAGDAARTIAAEAGGSPFLISCLARLEGPLVAGGDRLADVVARRLDHVESDARHLLAVVAVAGGPLERAAALEAAGLAESKRPLVFLLEEASLLRSTEVDGEGRLEVYHDRIREAVLAGLSEPVLQPLHRSVADAMRRRGGADPEAIYHHYRCAGETHRAGQWVTAAAERAFDALAFERAAGLYREALTLHPEGTEPWRLHARLAEALNNLGRGADAGAEFAIAADALAQRSEAAPDVVALRTRAARCWLRAGRLDEGIPRMRALLAGTGVRLPRTRLGVAVDAQLQRLRLAVRGTRLASPAPPGSPLRTRFSVCWAASTGLAVIDPLAADGFNTRSALAALAAGDASAAAAALGNEVAFEASLHSTLLRRHTLRLLDRTRELAEVAGHPYDRAAYQKTLGTYAYAGMRWRPAREHCDSAATIWRDQCHGVSWEIVTAESFALTALAHMGELRELGARLPMVRADAESRGDLFGATGLRMGMPTLSGLAQGRAEIVREDAESAIAPWPRGTFLIQHYLHLLATVHADLYLGEAWTAFRRIQRAWPAVWRGGMLAFAIVSVELRFLRARAAIAAAAAPSAPGAPPDPAWPRARLLALASREARLLARKSHLPPAEPFAQLVRAGVAHAGGRTAEAVEALEQAAAGFAAAGMSLHRAAARLAEGTLRGGETGEARRRETDAWMANQRVVDPPALVRTVAPGLPSE